MSGTSTASAPVTVDLSLVVHVVSSSLWRPSSASFTAAFTQNAEVLYMFPAPVSGSGLYTSDALTPLPSGLTYTGGDTDAGARTLSGTPNTPGVTNANYRLEGRSTPFVITVNPPLAITAPDAAGLTVPRSSVATLPAWPVATAGTGPYTYSASGLPDGLAFDASTRTVSGIPTKEGAFTVAYSAADNNGIVLDANGMPADRDASRRHGTPATATVSFDVTVGPAEGALSFATPPGDLTYQINSQFSTTLPAVSGATGEATYSLAPASGGSLPTGLAFDSATRILSGMSATESISVLHYVAEQGGNQLAVRISLAFITEEPMDLALGDPVDRTYTVGAPLLRTITDVSLPEATGGVPPYTYDLTLGDSGALPDRMSFSSSNRRLRGAIRAVPTDNPLELTYSVVDAIGARATQTMSITVFATPAFPAPAATPDFTARFVDGNVLHLVADTLMTPLVFPELVTAAETKPVSYEFDGTDLPTGLSFNNMTRTLSGIPEGTGLTEGVTYNGKTSLGATASLKFGGTGASPPASFNIRVAPPLTLPAVSDRNVYPGIAFSVMLPLGDGGAGSYTYSLSPESPYGLTFDSAARTLSGDPSMQASPIMVTYAVVDGINTRAERMFELTFASVAFAANTTLQDYNLTSGQPDIAALLPAATSNVVASPDIRYSLTSMPAAAGLSLDNSRMFSVDGSALITGMYELTYTATLHDGATASTATAGLSFSVTVAAAVTLSGGSREVTERGVLTGVDALPEAGGGVAPFAYTLAVRGTGGAITGVSFDPDDRTLTGTPGDISTAEDRETFTYDYTATDANMATATVTLTVNLNRHLELASQVARLYTVGVNVAATETPLTPAIGGSGAITYALSPTPMGITFTPSTRLLVGGATVTGMVQGRYTATDSTGTEVGTDITFTTTAAPAFAADAVTSLALRPYGTGEPIMLALPAVLPATGTGTITYALSPMPDGLSITGRTLSGSPATAATTELTWTATDVNGAAATLDFNLEVVAPLAVNAPLDRAYTLGEAVSLVLPVATGASGTPRYSLSTVPSGLEFTAATRTLAGTPDVTVSSQAIVYTAEDIHVASGEVIATARRSFTVTVNPRPQVTAPMLPVYSTGIAIDAEIFPAATGGTGSYTYSLEPLPAGLSFDADTRTLLGTPTAAGSTEVTYTAEDENEAVITATLTIVVTELVFADTSPITAQTYIQNSEITRLPLPLAMGGAEPLRYSLIPLPDGMGFDPDTFTLFGTPTTLAAMVALTYTATDVNGATASFDFAVSVVAMPEFAETIPDLTLTTGIALTSAIVLPELTRTVGAVTYTLTPALPTGLTFSSTGRMITGTPPDVVSDVEYTYAATDGTTMANAELTFNIEVVTGVSFVGGGTVADQTYPQSTAAVDLSLPAAAGGMISYALMPESPFGLTFNAGSGSGVGSTLTGQPDASGEIDVTYTATDSSTTPTTTTSIEFKITVVAVAFTVSEISNQIYRTNVEIVGPTLPDATTVAGPVSYSISPVLPAGLSFNENTRQISGTPTAASSQTEYAYTATDSATPPASSSLTFMITVNDLPLPEFVALAAIAEQIYTAGTAVDVTLPRATSTSGIARYSLTGNLPPGLTFNALTRQISGTPDAGTSRIRTEYTYTAIDAGQPPASVDLTFGIAVSAGSAATLEPVDFSFVVNPIQVGAAASFVWPRIVGSGDTVATFTNLPAGVRQKAAGSRETVGSPTTSGEYNVSYTAVLPVTGGDDTVVVHVFTWTVLPSLSGQSLRMYVGSTRAVSEVLPQAMGAAAPATYSTAALPPGFDFDPLTRTLTGTPTSYVDSTTAYTVTDGNGLSSSANLVFEYVSLSFAGVINPVVWIQGVPIEVQTLPEVDNNLNAVVYSIASEPIIPGLVLDADTRMLSGRPSVAGDSTLTYTATDRVTGDAASTTFSASVSVEAALTAPVAPSLSYNANTLITLVLPAVAGGGSSAAAYSLTVTADDTLPLPSGLSFDPATRTLAGTPDTVGVTGLTYRVMRHDGTPEQNPVPGIVDITASFVVHVVRELAFDNIPVDHIPTYTVGQTIVPLTLPAPLGGVNPLRYSLDPLPGGLSLDPATHTLSGMPQAPADAVMLTYSVTDATGLTIRTMLALTIANVPVPPTITDLSYALGFAIAGLPRSTLPEASAGAAPIGYSLEPRPVGLSFDPATRLLSGTPSALGPVVSTYSAMDSNGAVSSVMVTITIVPGLSFVTPAPASLIFQVNEAIDPYPLSTAVGGIGAITYAVTAMPPGLAFQADSLTLIGTPSGTYENEPLVYTATDADGNTITATILVTSAVSRALTATLADVSYSLNMAITPLQLPKLITGVTPITYRLSPVPLGLRFNPISRVLSGTPTRLGQTNAVYVVRDAQDNTPLSSDPSFTIVVAEPIAAMSSDRVAVVVDVAAQAQNRLGGWVGGVAPLRFSMAPLPPGLRLEVIGSAPHLVGSAQVVGTTMSTLTVTDANGASARVAFAIRVRPLFAFEDLIPDQYYSTDTAIKPIVLPQAVGVDAGQDEGFIYSLAIPVSGFSFNALTRTLEGTPPQPPATVVVTYSAQNALSTTVSQTFRITYAPAPAFTSGASIGNQVFTEGIEIAGTTALPAVAQATGIAPYTYSIVGAPSGVFLDANRQLAGTPASPGTYTGVIYRVTDAAGATADLTFNIEVSEYQHFAAFSFIEQRYTMGIDIALGTPTSLPVAMAGTPPYVYSVAPIPAGLGFDADERRFTGTPTGVGETVITYTAADSASPPTTISHTFTLQVVAELVFANAIVERGLTVDTVASGFALPVVNNAGGETVVYSLDGDLPGGLSLQADSSPPALIGTPTAAGDFPLTYTATAGERAASQSFVLQVQAADDTSNNAPVATDIPEQVISATRGTLSLDLAPYFSDADGDTISYSAVIQQEDGAASTFLGDASISGSLLLVRTLGKVHLPDAAGNFTPSMVSITAGDVFAATVTADVRIRVVGALTQRRPLEDARLVVGQSDGLYRAARSAADSTTSGLLGVFRYGNGSLPEGLSLQVASSDAEVVIASLSAADFAEGDVALRLTTAAGATAGDTATITLTATADGQSVAASFSVALTSPAIFVGSVPPEIILLVTQQASQVLPAATGGVSPLRYGFADPLPAGLSFDGTTLTLSGRPTVARQLAPITYTVTDASGYVVSMPVNLGILLPVTLPAVPAQAVTLNTPTSITLPAASGGASGFVYSLQPAISGLTFNAATRILSGTPDRQRLGTDAIAMTYQVTDSGGVTAIRTFDLTVTTPPVLDNSQNAVTAARAALQALVQGRFVEIVMPAVSAGSSAVRYQVMGLPQGLSFVKSTRAIYGFVGSGAAPSALYTVTDAGGASVTTAFAIDVTAAPASAPYFSAVNVIGDQVYAVGTTITGLVLPEAAGGTGSLTYNLEFALNVMSFNPRVRTLSGTPSQRGVYSFSYFAVDTNGDSALQTFTVTVGDSTAPVAVPVISQATLNEGEEGMLSGDASLPADADLTYQWRQIDAEGNAPVVAIASPNAATTAVTAPTQLVDDVVILFGLVVTADGISSPEVRVSVRVIAGVNDAPTANAGADQRAGLGEQVTLDGTASSDPEGETLAYDWSQTAGPTVAFSATDSSNPVFVVPTDAVTPLRLTFSLLVTDARGLTSAAADSVDVIVTNTEHRVAVVQTMLAVVGRVLGADVVDTITGRFDPNADAPSAVLGGHRLDFAAWRALFTGGAPASAAGYDFAANASPFSPSVAVNSDAGALPAGPASVERLFDQGKDLVETINSASSVKDLMADTRFVYNLRSGAAAGQNSIALWGQGSFNSLRGSPSNTMEYDGDLYAGYLGVDWRPNAESTIGLAFGYSESDFDLQSTLIGDSNLDTEISAFYLYGNTALSSGLTLWGVVGQSIDGSLTLTEEDGFVLASDLSLELYAVGLRQHLATRDCYSFAATLDGFISRLESDAVSGLPAIEAEASRLRAALTAEGRFVSGKHKLIPSVGLGVRYDSGDAETGIGLDIEGAFTLANDAGLSITARGRSLILHAASNMEDFGGSIAVSFDTGKQGQGLSLSLKPTWGQDESSAESLWQQDSLLSSPLEQASERPSLHMAFNAGYGILSNKMLITPFSELDMQNTNDYRLRIGTRLDVKVLNIELYVEQEADSFAANEQRIALSFTWQPATN